MVANFIILLQIVYGCIREWSHKEALAIMHLCIYSITKALVFLAVQYIATYIKSTCMQTTGSHIYIYIVFPVQ